MFNPAHNNGMGMPPENNGNNQQTTTGQAQSPNGPYHMVLIPIYRPIDQRSVEQIRQSADDFELRNDFRSAYRELNLLALRGDVDAQYKIGMYCFLALGMRESFSRAYLSFQRAAAQGHEEAQKIVALFDQHPFLKSLS